MSVGLGIAKDSLPIHRFTDTVALLDYCHSLGAAGIQAGLTSLDPAYVKNLRAKADEYGMYLELQAPLPKQDTTLFEQHMAAAKELGARCVRSVCLGGRRYETFNTLADFQKFDADSRTWIARALPVAEKYRVPLAIENHKDRTADELAGLMKSYSSEYLGVCLDTGNNIALLDAPMDVVRTLAPFALTTHIKDMAVASYPDGFLLSEVPLGQGMLDMKAIVQTISAARPKSNMVLEMITRDPLKIPCLTDRYWATFPNRSATYLAHALALVRDHASKLPMVSDLPQEAKLRREEDNVRQSLAWFREHVA